MINENKPITEELIESVTRNQEEYLDKLNSIVYILQNELSNELLYNRIELAAFTLLLAVLLFLFIRLVILPIETKRKLNEIKLIDSELKLLSIYNSSIESIVFIGLDNKILFLNKAAIELLKTGFGKVVREGDSIINFLFKGYESKLLESIENSLAGNFIEFDCKLNLSFSNTTKWFKFSFNPVFDHTNTILGVSIICKDINEKK